MKQHLVTLCVALIFISPIASASERTFRVETTFEKKVKGVPCRVVAAGIDETLSSPFRIKLPVDSEGNVMVKSITCKANGITRRLTAMPKGKFYGMTVDFVSQRAQFWFKKQNGGVAAYLRGDTLVRVR